MKKEKKKHGKAIVNDGKAQFNEKEQHDSSIQESDDDSIEVNDPGDCIGHWAVCKECEMCEIQDSCQAMTKNINEEGEDNAEEK
jgi:hypothetical protein